MAVAALAVSSSEPKPLCRGHSAGPGWSQAPNFSRLVCFHTTSGTYCHHLDLFSIKAHSLLLAADAVINISQVAWPEAEQLAGKGLRGHGLALWNSVCRPLGGC